MGLGGVAQSSRRGASEKRCFPSAAQSYKDIAGVSPSPGRANPTGAVGGSYSLAGIDGQCRDTAELAQEILSTGYTRTNITLTAQGRTECYEFEIYQRKQGHK